MPPARPAHEVNEMLYTMTATFKATDDQPPKLMSLDHWQFLLLIMLGKADTFELSCRPDDAEAVAFGQRVGLHAEGGASIPVFRGKCSFGFRSKIYTHSVDANGVLRWNTFTLFRRGDTVFSSRLHGVEILLNDLTEKEKRSVERFRPLFAAAETVDISSQETRINKPF